MADAAHRLGDRGEAGALGVRARLAVARDPGEDESRIRLAEALPAEIPLLERPRSEVLGQDVGLLDELEQQLLAPLRPEVERDALLVARLHRPPEERPS